MATNPTAGPWRMYVNGIRAIDSDGRTLREFHAVEKVGRLAGEDSVALCPLIDDAILISAAPALLAACRSALVIWAGDDIKLEPIRAAIRKATGEE